MDNNPVIVKKLLNANPEKVWKAITENEEMKKWYFNLADFKAEVGFQFQFTGGPDEGPHYLHLCEVTEVIPGRKITYSWRYDGFAGNSFVTFELIPQDEKTLLTLTHMGLESFPQENADFARNNFETGWDSIINDSLTKHLSTRINK